MLEEKNNLQERYRQTDKMAWRVKLIGKTLF